MEKEGGWGREGFMRVSYSGVQVQVIARVNKLQGNMALGLSVPTEGHMYDPVSFHTAFDFFECSSTSHVAMLMAILPNHTK